MKMVVVENFNSICDSAGINIIIDAEKIVEIHGMGLSKMYRLQIENNHSLIVNYRDMMKIANILGITGMISELG